MDQPKEAKGKQLQIELDEKVGSGEYANLAIVTHSPAEFIIDFTQVLPGMPKARVRSRIIMAPLHAKAFARALHDNIAKYEKRFGEIQTTPDEWMKELGIKLTADKMPN
ncbi:MAG: DUF3467 domain-containing protein [Candidatus Marinimicrobia bacterium]|nr:DUF3467 domain-containing protein [Candidatus Neomarinimicrobiota bacterium]